MIRMLDTYDECSMMTIGTISRLFPKRKGHEELYGELTLRQKAAVANFLKALPELVELNQDDSTRVEKALGNYWSRFL